jgi:hypothetical protein
MQRTYNKSCKPMTEVIIHGMDKDDLKLDCYPYLSPGYEQGPTLLGDATDRGSLFVQGTFVRKYKTSTLLFGYDIGKIRLNARRDMTYYAMRAACGIHVLTAIGKTDKLSVYDALIDAMLSPSKQFAQTLEISMLYKTNADKLPRGIPGALNAALLRHVPSSMLIQSELYKDVHTTPTGYGRTLIPHELYTIVHKCTGFSNRGLHQHWQRMYAELLPQGSNSGEYYLHPTNRQANRIVQWIRFIRAWLPHCIFTFTYWDSTHSDFADKCVVLTTGNKVCACINMLAFCPVIDRDDEFSQRAKTTLAYISASIMRGSSQIKSDQWVNGMQAATSLLDESDALVSIEAIEYIKRALPSVKCIEIMSSTMFESGDGDDIRDIARNEEDDADDDANSDYDDDNASTVPNAVLMANVTPDPLMSIDTAKSTLKRVIYLLDHCVPKRTRL